LLSGIHFLESKDRETAAAVSTQLGVAFFESFLVAEKKVAIVQHPQ